MLKLKLQIICNDIIKDFKRLVSLKLNSMQFNNRNETLYMPTTNPLEDQLEYLKLKFDSFQIEIGFILKQITENTAYDRNIVNNFFQAFISAVIEFMVKFIKKVIIFDNTHSHTLYLS